MSRFVLHVLLLLVLSGGAFGVREAAAQADGLPAIGADGLILPLAVDQLDAPERQGFAQLPPGSDAARQFLFTRGYLRYARLVVAGTLAAADLPDLPAEADWNRVFLNEEERGSVDVALEMKLRTTLGDRLPLILAGGEASPLTADQLDAEERQRFAQLPPGSDAARQFLYTRGYLRYARLVIAGKLAPLDLPTLPIPENWNRGFFSEQEGKDVDTALGMKLLAILSK